MKIKTSITVSGFLLMGSILSAQAKYTSIKEAFDDYAQERIKRARHFEKDKRNPIAFDLEKANLFHTNPIKLNTRNNEFSTIRCANSLIKATISNKLDVTNVKALEGGFVSGKIYRIDAQSKDGNSQNFYLKYLRQRPILVSSGRCYGEQANFAYLMNNPRVEKIQKHINIILPEMIAKYTNNEGNDKTFMLLPGAPGESLARIVQAKNIDDINEAFSALGTAFAKMHIEQRVFEGKPPITKNDFMNTRVLSHTDFHGNNVFYCPKTKKISFIDVETMANSFDSDNKPNSPISYDLLYMLLMSTKTFGDFMPKNDWEPFKKFLDAYTSEYSIHERAGILSYLESSFKDASKIAFTDIFKHFKWKKKMPSQAIKGAKELNQHIQYLKAQYLSSLRYRPLKNNDSEKTKKKIEAYYSKIKSGSRVQKFRAG